MSKFRDEILLILNKKRFNAKFYSVVKRERFEKFFKIGTLLHATLTVD